MARAPEKTKTVHQRTKHLEHPHLNKNDLLAMADVHVTLDDGSSFPCHSSVLSMGSKTLCSMFSSTEKASWETGLKATLGKYPFAVVECFLCMAYTPHADTLPDIFKKCHRTPGYLWSLTQLLHYLDCPGIVKPLDNYLVEQHVEFDMKKPESKCRSLAIAASIGAKKYREHCANFFLKELVEGEPSAKDITSKIGRNVLAEEELHFLLCIALGCIAETRSAMKQSNRRGQANYYMYQPSWDSCFKKWTKEIGKLID